MHGKIWESIPKTRIAESPTKCRTKIDDEGIDEILLARTAREMLAAKRPDIEIVGDDLHPLGKVKDFAPYVSKINASGADTVITGNWGSDMSLLIKASNDAGLKATYLTYWANISGSPTAIGDAGVGHIRVVAQWFSNAGNARTTELVRAYREHFPGNKDDLFITNHISAIEMLAKAMDQAKSGEPLQVAKALEGIEVVSGYRRSHHAGG